MTRELEKYLARLRHELRKRGLLDDRIIEEARGHLTDATERGIQRGLAGDAAETEALAQFGSPAVVAAGFAKGRFRILNWLRRMLQTTADERPSGFHDRQFAFHTALRTKRGWVDPQLLAIASDPYTNLGPYLERAAPRPLGPLGRLESVTLIEESENRRTYRAVFGATSKIVCTVELAPDGRAISIHWSKPSVS